MLFQIVYLNRIFDIFIFKLFVLLIFIVLYYMYFILYKWLIEYLQVFSQLFERFLFQKLFVRYKFRNKVVIRRNKKRKEDMFWVVELLNYRNNVANKQYEFLLFYLVIKIKFMYGRLKSEKETFILLGFIKDVSGIFLFFFMYNLLKKN